MAPQTTTMPTAAAAAVTPTAHYAINHATREDIADILTMINDLASYERALDSVHATPTLLAQTLNFAPHFGAPAVSGQGYAKCLLVRVYEDASPAPTAAAAAAAAATTTAATTGAPGVAHTASTAPAPAPSPAPVTAGMALYYPTYSTWLAAPGLHLEDLYVHPRFRGRGFGKALIAALARETRNMGGGRLEWSCLRWNESALGFYRGLGARELGEWVGLRVDGEGLGELGRDV